MRRHGLCKITGHWAGGWNTLPEWPTTGSPPNPQDQRKRWADSRMTSNGHKSYNETEGRVGLT